jgi:transcriptional regulator with XRE-family HTH domain
MVDHLKTAALARRVQPPKTLAAQLRFLEKRMGSQRAVADALGVTPRTIQRYKSRAGERRTPRADLATRISKLTREESMKGLSTRRENQLRRGARFFVSGFIGPKVPGSPTARSRTIATYIPGELMNPVVDALRAGDDQAANDAFTEALDLTYFDGKVPNLEGLELEQVDRFDLD